MSPETQNIESVILVSPEPIQPGKKDVIGSPVIDNGDNMSIEAKFDQADSEAETERLHDSPTKKRLHEEIEYEKQKEVLFDSNNSKRRKPSVGKHPENDNKASEPNLTEISETSKPHPSDKPHSAGNTEDNPSEIPPSENSKKAVELSDAAITENTAGEESHEVEDDADVDDDENTVDRESDEQRLNAIDALTEIEIEFANIRNRLHDQQIEKYDLEITMCENGLHPELDLYNKQLEENKETQLKRIRSLLDFEMDSIFKQSQATRCLIHQTFLKGRTTLRKELNDNITRKWNNMNRERNMLDYDPDYLQDCQRYQQTDSNLIFHEKKLLDFPLAPQMGQATDAECAEDLRSLGYL